MVTILHAKMVAMDILDFLLRNNLDSSFDLFVLER